VEGNLYSHSDRELVQKVLRGDTQAFSVVIRDTERLVAQIVRKMVSDAEDQKDLAQDIYLKAFQSLGTFKHQSKLSTWIGRIAFNTCCNYLEKKKILVVDITDIGERGASLSDGVDAVFARRELSQTLNAEIEKLPLLYKMLIILYHMEELQNSEISEVTGMPEGTIKSYLYRARNMLRKNIAKNYKNETL
jgi:RNA polymerase sigma-70 factor (ECF subfamily)